MLKKTITYTDFNGDQQTEDFYFNLSKSEIAEMELSTEGGLHAHLERIVASQNGGEIIKQFKEIIAAACGRRSEDGKRFVKSQEIRDDFFSSPAYDVLFIELLTDADKGAEFINGLLPQDLEGPVAPNLEKSQPIEGETNTPKEPKDMSREELMAAFMQKNQSLTKGSLQ